MIIREEGTAAGRSSELEATWNEILDAASKLIDLAALSGPDATFHDPRLRMAHDRLSDLLSEASTPEALAFCTTRSDFPPLANQLQSLNAELHRRTEIADAVSLATRPPGSSDGGLWVTQGFEQILRAQTHRWEGLGLSNVQDGRPIYIVGGGALPQTQRVLREYTNRQVISVERDLRSVEAARRLISTWPEPQFMPVIHADGRQADYQNAAVVVIATLVAEKHEVVVRIAETAPPDALLSVRIPAALHVLWRSTLDIDLLEQQGWLLRDRLSPSSAAIASLTFAR